MGRIQKKKDTSKKKALRAEKSSQGAKTRSDSNNVSALKPVPAKRTVVQPKSKTVGTEKTLPQKVVQFLLEVKIELKKVAWPSRKQTIGSTAVVVVLILIISVFLGVVDIGLRKMIQMLLP